VEDKDAILVLAADADSTAVTLGEVAAEEDITPLLVCCKDTKGLTVAPAEPLDPAEAVRTKVTLAVVEGEEVDDSFDPCAEREREGEGEEDGVLEEHLDSLEERELEALNVSCEERVCWMEGLLVGVTPSEGEAVKVSWEEKVRWEVTEA
jgi:hypothetical protein